MLIVGSGFRLKNIHYLLPHSSCFFRCVVSEKMSSLGAIPVVDIDPSGVFKYVLIKASQGSNERTLVRGYKWGNYHADIFEDFENKNKGLQLSCLGGGRIEHTPKEKKILVYGYSVGFGRAEHSITVSLLKERYPDYSSITFSDEGY